MYWSFSFSISSSNEYSGLISFRMDWFDLLAAQGALKSLLQHHSSKASILWHSDFFTVQLSQPYMTTGKTIALTRWTLVSKVVSLLENNRMGKTRDPFKKIRDTKGTLHAKMGSIKDGNSMDLTEANNIKERWQEYTGDLYKKDLHDQENHDGVITHLEPDILECEVKWALESITKNKASGGDGIPVELFPILNDDAVKGLHSICQQIWKTQQWPQD